MDALKTCENIKAFSFAQPQKLSYKLAFCCLEIYTNILAYPNIGAINNIITRTRYNVIESVSIGLRVYKITLYYYYWMLTTPSVSP